MSRVTYVKGLCCRVLQCVTVCCGVLLCVAVCCSVLRCVSVSTKRSACPWFEYIHNINTCKWVVSRMWKAYVAVHCSMLQWVAEFKVLQCVAVCCGVLQCVAVVLQWCCSGVAVCLKEIRMPLIEIDTQYICYIPYLYTRHYSFIYKTWLIHVRDTTRSHVWISLVTYMRGVCCSGVAVVLQWCYTVSKKRSACPWLI